MSELRKRDFRKYFETVHGVAPFPWQQRLLDQIVAEGRWPSSLDIPTGCGKTAALDVALFHLALEAGEAARRAPVRIALVVDRRSVVDQTSHRGTIIQRALVEPQDGVLGQVRERLALLSGNAREPLHVAVLRGGMAQETAWAKHPSIPTILASTVDQVGSRLLFRGYGVSDSMKPIHAGLLGNDALILLDEVHLSQPFAETLAALSERYRDWREFGLPDRWQYVAMSATARASGAGTFRLDEEDRAQPVLRQRLGASKPFRTMLVKTPADEREAQKALVAACQKEAESVVAPGRAIGLIVNRVAAARSIFEGLKASLGARADVFLLTGRMRPLDRADLDAALMPRIRAGRARDRSAPCSVVVSTQTLEAGADVDFDFLITECASLDALRQRFGRLNRLGQQPECGGVVIARADRLKVADPLYGEAYANTWKYLDGLERKDFGITALRLPPRQSLEALLSPEVHAPILLPAHLDLWAQTTPIPRPDPEVSLWLHGPERGEPEVQIVWRADLSTAEMNDVHERRVRDQIEACPPSAPEALSVPLSAARRWLREANEDISAADVEGEPRGSEDEKAPSVRLAFAWRGEQSTFVSAAAIRAGDTLVVPSSYGGIADANWAPAAQAPVLDLGDRAFGTARGRGALRTHPAVVAQHWPGVAGFVPPGDESETGIANVREAVASWLAAQPRVGTPKWLDEVVDQLRREKRRFTVIPLGDGDSKHFVLQTRGRVATAGEVTTEEETASFTGVEVSLDAHLEGVSNFARAYSEAAGLPPALIEDLAAAAAWHDAGKADPRFQVWLHGGSAFRAEVATKLLAKSAVPAADREQREEARRRAGYPRGGRHELLSVRLMEAAGEALRTNVSDWDLVLHLVSSHHGWCRPMAPVVRDEDVEVRWSKDGYELTASTRTRLESLDSGVVDRFWRLIRRYGWHGLAWMEAVLRLADHRRSEAEQKEGRGE